MMLEFIISHDARIYYINWTYNTTYNTDELNPAITYTTGTFAQRGQTSAIPGMNIKYDECINCDFDYKLNMSIVFNQSLPACIERYTSTDNVLDTSSALSPNTTSQTLLTELEEGVIEQFWWWWVLDGCSRGTYIDNEYTITPTKYL